MVSHFNIAIINVSRDSVRIDGVSFTQSKVCVFVAPDSSFAGIRKILDSANKTLKIMVYEFWSPDIKEKIIDALNRGVKIYLLVEGETYGTEGNYWNRDTLSELYELNRTQNKPIWIRLENTDRYLHAKVIIADGSMVFVSSENFMPTSYPPKPNAIELTPYDRPSRGWGTIIKNPAIAGVYEGFFDSIFFSDALSREYNPEEYREAPERDGIKVFRPIASIKEFNAYVYPVFSPDNSFDTIKWMISRANYTIYLSLMYIVSDSNVVDQLIDELVKARNKGVTIHIILEDDFAGYYGDIVPRLRSHGFHVVPAFSQDEILFLHNKGIIVDDVLVLIGSINWSGKALSENWEAGILIKSREVALYYKRIYEYDWNKSSTKPFDGDNDGLSDYYEEEHGYNPNNPDTDGDGIDDWEEVFIYNNKYGGYKPRSRMTSWIILTVIVIVVIIVMVVYISKRRKHNTNNKGLTNL